MLSVAGVLVSTGTAALSAEGSPVSTGNAPLSAASAVPSVSFSGPVSYTHLTLPTILRV